MDTFDALEELILNKNVTRQEYSRYIRNLKNKIDAANGEQKIMQNALLRLALALKSRLDFRESDVGAADLAVLIRQVIFSHNRTIKINNSLWEEIKNRATLAGLYTSEQGGSFLTVSAQKWCPHWLDETENFEKIENRREMQHVLGDGILTSMTGGKRETYMNIGQKALIDAALFSKSGQTILASLPTGGGKSLGFTLPAWLASQGGRKVGGTSLVVVPTVSLAIDQANQTRDFFPNAASEGHWPKLLIGSTPSNERAVIYEGLKNGTLPLLFTSPEALLNNVNLYNKILQTANNRVTFICIPGDNLV